MYVYVAIVIFYTLLSCYITSNKRATAELKWYLTKKGIIMGLKLYRLRNKLRQFVPECCRRNTSCIQMGGELESHIGNETIFPLMPHGNLTNVKIDRVHVYREFVDDARHITDCQHEIMFLYGLGVGETSLSANAYIAFDIQYQCADSPDPTRVYLNRVITRHPDIILEKLDTFYINRIAHANTTPDNVNVKSYFSLLNLRDTDRDITIDEILHDITVRANMIESGRRNSMGEEDLGNIIHDQEGVNIINGFYHRTFKTTIGDIMI